MTLLVTGGAGFIGSHLCERLIERGDTVVALDNFDPFYPELVKRRNIRRLESEAAFRLVEADIRDVDGMERGLEAAGVGGIDVVVHLAARAGVRPSIEEPFLYSQVNLDGSVAVLELARRRGSRRFIFGSSSSVYGNNEKVPFAESDPVDHPISPYAATKRAGELLCHTYHHLYGLSIVCLRFFTVYGPRQRPDLAIHKFARLMREGRAIPMFGDGSTERDYTYIDDIVAGVIGAIAVTEGPDPVWEIANLGGSRTTSLSRLIELIAGSMGVVPSIDRLPAQPGDVERTFADVRRAKDLFGYEPSTPIEAGIPRFVEWFESDGA
jgi:UDP-glucuronate 4-epimerase